MRVGASPTTRVHHRASCGKRTLRRARDSSDSGEASGGPGGAARSADGGGSLLSDSAAEPPEEVPSDVDSKLSDFDDDVANLGLATDSSDDGGGPPPPAGAAP